MSEERGASLQWLILLAALVTLGLWGADFISDQREFSDREVRYAAEMEMAFVKEMSVELLEQGVYEDLDALLQGWGKRHADTIELRLTAPTGFVIGRFKRELPASDKFTLKTQLRYGYEDQAELYMVKTLDAVNARHRLLLLQASGAFSLVSVLGVFLTYAYQRRKREAQRLHLLSERLSRSNQELEQEVQRRIQVENALHSEKENAEVTLQSIGDAVITTDNAGQITRMNPVAESITGWTQADALGKYLYEVLVLQNQHGAPLENPSDTLLRRGKVTGLGNHTVLISKQGRSFQISDSAAPIHGKRGAIEGVVLVFRNVTEEYRIRRALEESETRFRRMTDNLSEHFLYSHNPDGMFEYVTPSLTKVLGYSQQEFYTHFTEYMTDSPVNRKVLDHTEASSRGIQQPAYEVEMFHKDGSRHVLEVREAPIMDENGKVIAVEGIAHDITKRKLSEAELRLASSVFEETSEGIMVTDMDGVIQRVNRAFSVITGFSESEAMGQPAAMLRSGRHQDAFYQTMWKALKETGAWKGEVWNRRKDGSLYPEWLSITRIDERLSDKPQFYVGVFSDISAFKEAEQEIARLAFHDALTELPNRLLLLDRLETFLARSKREQEIDALLFLDLDQFKHINDSLGHSIGDHLLCEVARRLKEQIRETDTVARLGGDEFVVVLTALGSDAGTATARARAGAEKIRRFLGQPYTVSGHVLHTTPSIGIAMLPIDADNPEDALKHADQAMYRAKASGRNTVEFFLPQMQSSAKSRLKLEQELREALEKDQLRLHYQPFVDLNFGRIAGAEALIRWQHPEQGLMSPGSFIPMAEESGLILEIGTWVIKQACRQAKAWQNAGLPACPIAVNLSAVQFRHRDLVQDISAVLRELDLDPRYLELELTESLLLENIQSVMQTLAQLAQLGIRISLDDFGTGYSSLSYLRRFTLHKLKIDRSFIDDIPDSASDATMTTTIIQMAHNLNLWVVAEGVETTAQLEFLKQHGCDLLQGYLFSKPVDAASFEELLKAGKALG